MMNRTNIKPTRRKFLASLGALGVEGLLPAPSFTTNEKSIQANQPVFRTAPALNDAGVDLLISGHAHVYRVHPPAPGKRHYPIVIGGGPKDGKRTIIKVYTDERAFNLDMLDDAWKLVGNVKI